jgi:hypothetical protein
MVSGKTYGFHFDAYLSAISAAFSMMISATYEFDNALRYLTGNTM